MKATYNGWEIEGTPDEIKAVISPDSNERAVPLVERTMSVEAAHVTQAPVKKHYRKRAPNRFHVWTKVQDDEIKRLYLGGLTSTQVAKKVGRTAVAIQARLSSLGVSKGVRKSAPSSSPSPSGRKHRTRSGFPVRPWSEEDDRALQIEWTAFRQQQPDGDVDAFDRRFSKQHQRSVKAVQQRRTLKKLVTVHYQVVRAPSLPSSSISQSPVSQEHEVYDDGALVFKEVSVDKGLVDSLFKHMIKMGGRINWQNTGYMLGIESSAKFKDWVSSVISRSNRLAQRYGVANKFKTDGRELWYGG